jgi:fused signal recognition particle receptor
MAVFGGLRKKLSKTREGIVGKIQTLVINKRKIDDELLEEIEEILIGSDISVDVTMDIIERLQELIRKRGYADSKELMAVLTKTTEPGTGHFSIPIRNLTSSSLPE